MICPNCNKKMVLKDSNVFDKEYWEGYKCQYCGNVELITIPEEEYDRKVEIYEHISTNLSYMTICPSCRGMLQENIANETYTCRKCYLEIPIEQLYFKKTGLIWDFNKSKSRNYMRRFL